MKHAVLTRACAGQVQVLRHLRVKHACPGCEQGVKSTPLPERILPKTSACAGLLAHLVTSKDVDSLATIAKTNRIRPCCLGRRWNGNHQPR